MGMRQSANDCTGLGRAHEFGGLARANEFGGLGRALEEAAKSDSFWSRY